MTKKGYPGLVLVPPSDRTIVRRRFVRWSLFGLAIVWGMSAIINSWFPPSDKSDCQTSSVPGSPTTTQEGCNPSPPSPVQPQQRAEETSSVIKAPQNMGTAEVRNSSASSSPDPLLLTSGQTTDHPLSANSPAVQNTAADHALQAQPENRSTSNQLPTQPTRSTTIADHNAVAQTGSGEAPQQSVPPSHTASERKAAIQPSHGSASTLHQSPKPANNSTDHKLVTQAPKESATPPIPNQPAKASTPTTEHKAAPQPGNGPAPSQALHQPAKSLGNSADRKLLAPSPTGSPSSQTSNQPIPPTPTSTDRKVAAQLGNGSAISTHPTGDSNTAAQHTVAGQSENGISPNQALTTSSHQDTRLAEEGDAFAQYRLGRFFAQQGGRQTPEALKWYKKASSGLRHLAEAGNGQAMYVLGVMYAYGRGVKKDTEQARHWLSRAVNHKITAARPLLASLERDETTNTHTR